MKIMCIVFYFGLFCSPFNLNMLHCASVTWNHAHKLGQRCGKTVCLQVNKVSVSGGVCMCIFLFAFVFMLLCLCVHIPHDFPDVLTFCSILLLCLDGDFQSEIVIKKEERMKIKR